MMSKMEGLQEALQRSSGKVEVRTITQPSHQAAEANSDAGPRKGARLDRLGKEYVGAWLNGDFNSSLRMAQLRRRRDALGNKIFLDDLIAEALNDLFIKYDVPTVRHE